MQFGFDAGFKIGAQLGMQAGVVAGSSVDPKSTAALVSIDKLFRPQYFSTASGAPLYGSEQHPVITRVKNHTKTTTTS